MGHREMKEREPSGIIGVDFDAENDRMEYQRPADAIPCPTNERAGSKGRRCVDASVLVAIVGRGNDVLNYLDGKLLVGPVFGACKLDLE